MKRLSSRDWKALTLLSIVVPVSLLTTLRLTGILQGPIIIRETTTLEAVQREFERPGHDAYIDDTVETTRAKDGLLTVFRVVIGTYSENQVVYDNNDVITLGLNLNSTMMNPNDFVESVSVIFGKDSQPSLVDWIYTYTSFQNLSLVGISSGWTSEESQKEAYVRFASLTHSEKISIWATAVWSLLTPNNRTHQMELAFELTYYNGTVYKKIIQPFYLKIIGR